MLVANVASSRLGAAARPQRPPSARRQRRWTLRALPAAPQSKIAQVLQTPRSLKGTSAASALRGPGGSDGVEAHRSPGERHTVGADAHSERGGAVRSLVRPNAFHGDRDSAKRSKDEGQHDMTAT